MTYEVIQKTRYINSSIHPVPGAGRVILPWFRTGQMLERYAHDKLSAHLY